MIGLGMSDKEIVQNLLEAGVSERETKSILRSVKTGLEKNEEPKRPKQEVKEEPEEMVEEEPQEVEEEPEEDFEDVGKSAISHLKNMSFERPLKEQIEVQPSSSGGLSDREQRLLDMWEKGILAVVDTKLAEMKKLKEEIDSSLEKKAEAAFEKESKKLSSVMDSQRVLMIEKANLSLDQKAKVFEQTVDTKIKELKNLNSLSEDYLKRLESSKKFNESLLETMDQRSSELVKTKTLLVGQFESELSKTKKGVEDFLRQAEAKRNELNDRINRSLNLETEIVEGLLNDAKNKIDKLSLSKMAELEKMVDVKVGSSFQSIQGVFAEKERSLERSVNVLKASAQKELDELALLKKDIDVETVKSTIEELNAYRKQFVSTIAKSVESFEAAKNELSGLVEKWGSLIDKKVELVDEKVRELELLERSLSEKMENFKEQSATAAVQAPPAKKSRFF